MQKMTRPTKIIRANLVGLFSFFNFILLPASTRPGDYFPDRLKQFSDMIRQCRRKNQQFLILINEPELQSGMDIRVVGTWVFLKK